MTLLDWADRRWSAATDLIGTLSPRAVLWASCCALLAIFAIVGLNLLAARMDVRDAAWTASRNLLSAVSKQIENDITMLDMSLLDLRDGASRADATDLQPSLRAALLFDRSATANGLGSLMLLDASGRISEQAGTLSPPALDYSGQSFFRVQRDGDLGLYISQPFVSLIDGEPSIALSRRVERDGRFAGVAVATLKLSHFKDVYSRLDLGERGTLALALDDGTMVMRQPFAHGDARRGILAESIQTLLATDPAEGVAMVSPFDGVPRQYFCQRIGPYPLIQIMGASLHDVYVQWWTRAALTGVAMALIGGAMLLLMAAVQAELRRRIAAEAALAIIASTDKLTGLANRRSFDEAFERAWRLAALQARPISLLLADVDHFKDLNDAVGHLAGDAVLAALGAVLRALPVGNLGLVARYGGEEFAVLLPSADADEAAKLGEILRQSVHDLGHPHPSAASGRVTISVGVATLQPQHDAGREDLVDLADGALYDAKRRGRDRVERGRATALAA